MDDRITALMAEASEAQKRIAEKMEAEGAKLRELVAKFDAILAQAKSEPGKSAE